MHLRPLSIRHLRPTLIVALAVLVAGLAAACGSDPDDANDAGSLVLYSGRSESLVDPIIQEFADLTGIDVQVKYAGTASLAATLLEEGDKSPADVFYAQDPGGLGAVESMLAALPAETLANVPEWARSPDGLWVGISGRARVLVYNPERVTMSELPASIEGLTDPKWKGRIGWAPTNGSFLTMVTGMRKLWGEERTQAWIEGMVANEAGIYTNNTSQVAAVASGEIDVGLVNHYYLYRFLAEEGEGFPARNYDATEGGPGSLVMVSGVGVLATAKNRENAERLVSFLLSRVAQQYFASQTFEYPLVEGVLTNRLLTPLEEINRPDIRLADLSDLAGTTELLRSAGALP